MALKAIRYNSTNGTAETLCFDLRNSPCHIFGEHRKCRKYFCKNKTEDVETAKIGESPIPYFKTTSLVLSAIESITRKADRLSIEESSNRAELFMSLFGKYTGGKRLNRIQRDNYERRCTLAGQQYQKGHAWHYSPCKTMFKKSWPKNLMFHKQHS